MASAPTKPSKAWRTPSSRHPAPDDSAELLLELPLSKRLLSRENLIMSITIFHNPRCSKSRKTLELLESNGVNPAIVEYLQTPPDADALQRIAALVGRPLAELLRRGEDEFRNAGDTVPLDDEAALAAWLHEHPKVLERPIVVDDDNKRAVVGRPPENVLDLL